MQNITPSKYFKKRTFGSSGKVEKDEGKIILDGTPSKVFGSPDAMWKAGLDVPQTTELAYKLRRAGLDVPLDLFDPDDCAKAVAAAVLRKRIGGRRGGKS